MDEDDNDIYMFVLFFSSPFPLVGSDAISKMHEPTARMKGEKKPGNSWSDGNKGNWVPWSVKIGLGYSSKQNKTKLA